MVFTLDLAAGSYLTALSEAPGVTTAEADLDRLRVLASSVDPRHGYITPRNYVPPVLTEETP